MKKKQTVQLWKDSGKNNREGKILVKNTPDEIEISNT